MSCAWQKSLSACSSCTTSPRALSFRPTKPGNVRLRSRGLRVQSSAGGEGFGRRSVKPRCLRKTRASWPMGSSNDYLAPGSLDEVNEADEISRLTLHVELSRFRRERQRSIDQGIHSRHTSHSCLMSRSTCRSQRFTKDIAATVAHRSVPLTLNCSDSLTPIDRSGQAAKSHGLLLSATQIAHAMNASVHAR